MSRKTLNFNANPLLSGPSLDSRVRSGSPFRFIPISDIDVDPDQPRRVFDNEALAELAASIERYGVLSPILVKLSAGGTFRLIAGERRLRACKLLGLHEVPAVIDPEEDNAETLSKQLVENLQRADLSPMERALAIGQLRDSRQLSVRDIARNLGISKSLVQRSLDILALPDDLQAALINGASESKVLLLARIEDREQRQLLLEQVAELSRRELEEKILSYEGGDPSELSHGGTVAVRRGRERTVSAEDQRLVEDLQRALGTKVAITRDKNREGQGRIQIEFYSSDDLGEIYRRLTN